MSRPRYSAYCTGANGTKEHFWNLDAWDPGGAESAAYSRWKWAHPDETCVSVSVDCISTADSFDSEYVSGEVLFGGGGARWN